MALRSTITVTSKPSIPVIANEVKQSRFVISLFYAESVMLHSRCRGNTCGRGTTLSFLQRTVAVDDVGRAMTEYESRVLH